MPDAFQDMSFPKAGIDLSMPFWMQQPRPMPDGQYARTTPLGVNVRSFDPLTKRMRGGSRAGLVKYVTAAVIADWMLQDLAVVTWSSESAVA